MSKKTSSLIVGVALQPWAPWRGLPQPAGGSGSRLWLQFLGVGRLPGGQGLGELVEVAFEGCGCFFRFSFSFGLGLPAFCLELCYII